MLIIDYTMLKTNCTYHELGGSWSRSTKTNSSATSSNAYNDSGSQSLSNQ
jgi:hypothetical protein